MQVEKTIRETLTQLQQVLGQLSADEYTAQPAILNGSSIGQHCRHLLDAFVCLENGYDTGIINYENRNRNKDIEQHKETAQKHIEAILHHLNKPEKSLTLCANYSIEDSAIEEYKTSYTRELAYALEHAVHHTALIGVGIKVVAPNVVVPKNFGVASSTVKYRNSLAQ